MCLGVCSVLVLLLKGMWKRRELDLEIKSFRSWNNTVRLLGSGDCEDLGKNEIELSHNLWNRNPRPPPFRVVFNASDTFLWLLRGMFRGFLWESVAGLLGLHSLWRLGRRHSPGLLRGLYAVMIVEKDSLEPVCAETSLSDHSGKVPSLDRGQTSICVSSSTLGNVCYRSKTRLIPL